MPTRRIVPEYPQDFVDSLNASLASEPLEDDSDAAARADASVPAAEPPARTPRAPRARKPVIANRTVVKIVALTLATLVVLLAGAVWAVLTKDRAKDLRIRALESALVSIEGAPLPSETGLVNVARVDQGAAIIDAYTSSPPHGWWWALSRSYVLDPTCMIRRPTPECWPMANSAAVGIRLAGTTGVRAVSVDLAQGRVPRAILVLAVNRDGSTTKIAESLDSNTANSTLLVTAAEIVVKVFVDGTACVRTISALGIAPHLI